MNVGSNAMVSLHNGLIRIADALVYLIALTLLTFKLETNLLGGFCLAHRRVNRQQPQSRQTGYVALNALWVFNALSQHLVTATDSYYHLSFTMGTLDGLCASVSAQFQQIVQRRFRSRQNNDVSLLNI